MSKNVANGAASGRFRNASTSSSDAYVDRSAEEVLDMLTWVGNNSTVWDILSLQVLVI